MSEAKRTWRRKLRDGWRRAFALDDGLALTSEDHALLEKLARAVVRRRMAMPAILFLHSVRPLNTLGSQAMVFLKPFVGSVFKPADYDRVTRILDRRRGITAMIEAIEAAEAHPEDCKA